MTDSAGPEASGGPPPIAPAAPARGPFDRALHAASSALHTVAGVTMILLVLWTVVDIVGRAFFARPLPGTVELTELAVIVMVYLGLARAQYDDAHIRVDLLYARLGAGAQRVMRVAAGLLSLLVVAVLTWRLAVFAGQLRAGGFTTGVLGVPLFPVAVAGVIGATAFALAILSGLVAGMRARTSAR